MNPTISRFADTARWIATVWVTMHHVHNVFVNQHDIMQAPKAWYEYVWWFLNGFAFGHAALVVFFVLSGYLVGGALIEKADAGKPFVRSYLIDRIARIYVVFLPGLILSAVLDYTGAAVFRANGVYAAVEQSGHLAPLVWLQNLVSLQGVWFPTFGTNVALWSLAMEFWYYFVGAFLVLPLSAWYRGRGWAWFGLGAGVLLLAALAWPGSFFFFGFLIWLVGAAARRMRRPLLRSRWLALVLWIVPLIVIRLAVRGSSLEGWPWMHIADSINALLFANLLLTLRFDESGGFSFCNGDWHRKLADFSFTTYIVHVPLLYWMWGLSDWVFGAGWRFQIATPLHYVVALLAALALFAIAWGCYWCAEAHTTQVRNWMRRVLPGGGPAKPA